MKQCLFETMRVGGENNYIMSRMSKSKLIKEGRLPITFESDFQLIEKVKSIDLI